MLWRDERELATGGQVVLAQHLPFPPLFVLNHGFRESQLLLLVLRHDAPWLSDERAVPVGVNTHASRLATAVDDILGDVLASVPETFCV